MTKERRAELLDLCADTRNHFRWAGGPPISWGEAQEALQAHEELETAVSLLHRFTSGTTATNYGPGGNYASMYETCNYCRRKRSVDAGSVELLIHASGCPVARAESLLAAHDARTAGTAAKEGT